MTLHISVSCFREEMNVWLCMMTDMLLLHLLIRLSAR